MWFSPYPKTFCANDLEVFLVVDIWGLSWGPQDFWLENRLESRSVERLGKRKKFFVFLSSFLEIEGLFTPLVCPPSCFPFRKIGFAGLFLEEEDPWVRLPNLVPEGTKFDYYFFFVGIVLWARLGWLGVVGEHSRV